MVITYSMVLVKVSIRFSAKGTNEEAEEASFYIAE